MPSEKGTDREIDTDVVRSNEFCFPFFSVLMKSLQTKSF